MNISRYMKKHEAAVRQLLIEQDCNADTAAVLQKHVRITGYMQHERLIHLIVTLAFGFFLLAAIVGLLVKPVFLMKILSALLFALLIPYIAHYFFLENAIQRWYELADRMEAKLHEDTPINKKNAFNDDCAASTNVTDFSRQT